MLLLPFAVFWQFHLYQSSKTKIIMYMIFLSFTMQSKFKNVSPLDVNKLRVLPSWASFKSVSLFSSIHLRWFTFPYTCLTSWWKLFTWWKSMAWGKRIVTELVDIGPRPIVMALGSVANWGFSFLIGASYTKMASWMGEYVFLLFAWFTLLLMVLIM